MIIETGLDSLHNATRSIMTILSATSIIFDVQTQ